MDMKLANGITVTTYSPPAGIDPLTADNADLVKAGFPARPTDPRLLAQYNQRYSRLKGRLNYITPTFREEPHIVHGPRARAVDEATQKSPNWSGAVVQAPAGSAFTGIQGDWVVPNVAAPTENQWYYAASWIGIDGDGSDDVCQAGIACSAFRSGAALTVECYPWWEWYPAASVAITNFPVGPGDLVNCLIFAEEPGSTATQAIVYLTNLTNGAATSFRFSAPGGTVLAGNCAEWIVEAPTVDSQLSALADYGQVFFSKCMSVALPDGASEIVVDGGTGDSVNLVANGTDVSEAILVTPAVVECQYVGPLPA